MYSVSVMFTVTVSVPVGANNANVIIDNIMTIFMINVIVEYVPAMLLLNFFAPTCNTHMPYTNAKINVRIIDNGPKNKQDINVIIINIAMVFVGCANVQLIMLLYQLLLYVMTGSFLLFVLSKKPAVHSPAKPNGKLPSTFQSGMLKACIRSILAYILEINMPARYNKNNPSANIININNPNEFASNNINLSSIYCECDINTYDNM